jgi:hypothetical protein
MLVQSKPAYEGKPGVVATLLPQGKPRGPGGARGGAGLPTACADAAPVRA